MTLKKKFLHTDIKSLDFSITRMIIGVLIGLFYAFSFYTFFYISREALRMITITENYDLIVLSESEVKSTNLFFAYISVILGQSYTFIYLIERPRAYLKKRLRNKSSIIHEQRVLNWVFLSWYSRMATVFGFLYVALFLDSYYIPILLIIVLFLQTWNSIRLSFKGKSLLWMFFSFIIVSLLSFSFSNIQIIDYKKLNYNILSKNIEHAYSIELPLIENSQSVSHKNLCIDTYVVPDTTNLYSKKTFIYINNIKQDLDSVQNHIDDIKKFVLQDEIPYVRLNLFIHQHIKMNEVNLLFNKLAQNGINWVSYAGYGGKENFYSKLYIHQQTHPFNISHFKEINSVERYINHYDNNLIILLDENAQLKLNNTNILKENLKKVIVDSIKNNPNYLIVLQSNKNVYYSTFIEVLLELHDAVFELRNNYSLEVYSLFYNELNYVELKEINKKYPFRIIQTFK